MYPVSNVSMQAFVKAIWFPKGLPLTLIIWDKEPLKSSKSVYSGYSGMVKLEKRTPGPYGPMEGT